MGDNNNNDNNETEQNSNDFSMSDLAQGVGGVGRKAAKSVLGLNSKKKEESKGKKAAKSAAKAAGKAVLKALRVIISLIPLPVKIGILLVIVCLLIYAFKKEQSALASDNTTNTVKTVMDVYAAEEPSSEDVTINGEKVDGLEYAKDEKELKRRQSLAKFFNENSSFVNMKLSDIKTVYETFCQEYEIKKNKGSNSTLDDKLYTSYTTPVGESSVYDEEDGSLVEKITPAITKNKNTGEYEDNLEYRTKRIVNEKETDYFFEKMLLTEKYNMNKVEWHSYGHGDTGSVMSYLKQDVDYGIQYPSSLKQDTPTAWDESKYLERVVKVEDVDTEDGKDRETFTKLLTPYLQSWLIPLSYYSGLVSEGIEAEAATQFAYSVIKNTYSNVIANRYKLQDYILNTKFDEYYIYHYRTSFDIQILTSQGEQITNNTKTKETAFKYVVSAKSGSNSYKGRVKENGKDLVLSDHEAEEYCKRKNGSETTAPVNNPGYYFYTTTDEIEGSSDTKYILYYEGVTKEVQKEVNVSTKTDTEKYSFFNKNGNLNNFSITPVLEKTEYYNQRLEPTTVTIPDNGVLTQDMLGSVDYKKESVLQQVDQGKETGKYISVRYYVSQADTFDVKIATQYNYIKYSDDYVKDRVNEDSKSELKTEAFEEKQENNIKEQDIIDVLSDDKSLDDVAQALNSSIVSIKPSGAGGSSQESVDYLSQHKNVSLNKLKRTVDKATGVGYIVVNFKANEEFTEKIGNPDGNVKLANGDTLTNVVSPTGETLGTHYIQRKWNDRLNISSTKTSQYTVADLTKWNEDYEEKNNITDGFKFTTRLAISYESSEYYKDLEDQKILNRVDFINANRSIFKNYLYERASYSDTIGYYRSILQSCLDELKKQFSDILERNKTYPFKYGETLGFRDLVDNILGTNNTISAGFIWPVDNKYVSAIQGYSAVYGEPHSGVDIWASLKSEDISNWNATTEFPVYAIASGTIIGVYDNNIPNTKDLNGEGLGNYVVIKHDNGYISTYGHLSTGFGKTLEVGQKVTQGQPIACIGSSGNSSCMHLHFNIYDNTDGSDTISPANKLDPLDFYIVEINPDAAKISPNIPQYAELKANETLRNDITMFNAYMITGSKGGGTGALHDTVYADSNSFVAAAKAGISNRSGIDPNSDFLNDENLALIYKNCTEANLSPELCVVIAISENHTLSGYGQKNYWNVGVFNSDDPNNPEKGYATFEEALNKWIENTKWVGDTNDWRYTRAMQRIDSWGSKIKPDGTAPRNFAPGVYNSIAFYKCVYSVPDELTRESDQSVGSESNWGKYAEYLDEATDILLNVWKNVFGG